MERHYETASAPVVEIAELLKATRRTDETRGLGSREYRKMKDFLGGIAEVGRQRIDEVFRDCDPTPEVLVITNDTGEVPLGKLFVHSLPDQTGGFKGVAVDEGLNASPVFPLVREKVQEVINPSDQATPLFSMSDFLDETPVRGLPLVEEKQEKQVFSKITLDLNSF